MSDLTDRAKAYLDGWRDEDGHALISELTDRINKLEAGLNQILTISYDPYLHSEDEPHGWYLGVSAAQTIAQETLNE